MYGHLMVRGDDQDAGLPSKAVADLGLDSREERRRRLSNWRANRQAVLWPFCTDNDTVDCKPRSEVCWTLSFAYP